MDASGLAPLIPLDEDWETALAVVAHPDDMEFGAAAAVARWTGQGKRVVYCMVTSGEAGIDSMDPARAREVREAEQVASARVVGVDQVEFLRLPDGILEYGVGLRRAIAQVVREQRPEIVITGNFRETFGGSMLNQADHIAVGRATLDAVRDAANRGVFPEVGPAPWSGVRQVWAAGSPEATHAVDTTETFDLGVASLLEHAAYITGLGWADFDGSVFLDQISRPTGERMGVTHASAFEVFPLGWGSD